MVGKSPEPCPAQFICQVFYIVPALAVDDPGFSPAPAQVVGDFREGLFFWPYLIVEVPPVKTGNVRPGFRYKLQAKLGDYVFLNPFRGCCR